MKKEYKFLYEHYATTDELPAGDRELVDRALEACAQSYAPYSGFRVGAAALLTSGAVIAASNQESIAFPAGICAERNLLTSWQSQYTDDHIESMAIASVPGSRECYPCGLCRQVLSDTEQRQGSPIRIIMASNTSVSVVSTSSNLMPFTFKLQD